MGNPARRGKNPAPRMALRCFAKIEAKSVMSNIVKSKFVGLLRGLLRRYDNGAADMVVPPQPADTTTTPSATPRTSYQQGSYLRAVAHAGAPRPQTQPIFPKPQIAAAKPAAAPAASREILQLPLASVVAVLPMDLRAKLTRTPPPGAMVSLPVESVLSQLATGSVKMTFGELRAAHAGMFPHTGVENDARQIVLPLQEILSRVNPALLSRRVAKKMEVTDEEIPGPFSSQMPAAHSAPAQVPVQPAPLPPQPASRPSVTPRITIPVRQVAPPAAKNGANGATAARPSPAAPAHAAPVPGGFNSAPQIPIEASKDSKDFILVPLSALAEKWPDGIKRELVQANLFGAQLALPAALIEPGMRSGRMVLAWKKMRPMIRPTPAPASAHDNVELELPLKVLAPLFLASRKTAGKMKPVAPSSEEIPDMFFGSNGAHAAAAPALDLEPASAPEPVVPLPITPVIPLAPGRPIVPAAPVAPAAPAPATAPAGKTITAPLSSLLEKWPEALRQEIEQWNLADAQVALPVDVVSPMVKRGRVKFLWRELRSLIRPAAGETSPAHDETELELPLKVIAPLFLEQQAPKGRRPLQPDVDDSIPNFFFDIPTVNTDTQMRPVTPVPASKSLPPAPKPLDYRLSETNFYTWGDTSDAPRVDLTEAKRSVTPGTDFTSRYSTPKEIVARAMAVPGVAGAVVALYDGLAIASQLPEEMNADTVAAFLPQIFSRTSQSTKELRMGELNNLSFTVGNVPWVIFCVSSVYFAAFGTAGGTLPVATLAALAKQLDRRSK